MLVIWFLQKKFTFAVRDSLLNIGPLKDFSYGLRINGDPNATGVAKQSNYELVSCSFILQFKLAYQLITSALLIVLSLFIKLSFIVQTFTVLCYLIYKACMHPLSRYAVLAMEKMVLSQYFKNQSAQIQ